MKKKYALALCVAGVFLLFFFGIFFKGKTLSTTAITPGVFSNGVFGYDGHVVKTLPLKDPGAFSWHHYPMMYLNKLAYSSGQFPLWNPYSGSGQPLLANQQSAGLFLLHIPLFFSSSLLVWDLFMIFRLLIAFIFTYLFAKRIGYSQNASFLSAVVFSFCGYFWFFITMNHLSIEILIPAAFYFCERIINEESRTGTIGLSAIIGLALLGGMPESSFLLVVLTFSYFIVRLIIKSKESGKDFFLKKGGYFIISLLIGFALSAVVVLPFIEFLKYSHHAHASGSSAGLRRSLYRGLSDLLIPNFSWPGPNWANIKRHFAFHYVGVLPLFLAFLSKKRKWPSIFFLTLAVFYLLKLVGFPIVNQIGNLPFFKSVYYPKYLAPYFAFSIAVLAGSALDDIKNISLKKLFVFFSIYLSAVALTIIYYWSIIQMKGATKAIFVRTAKPLFFLCVVGIVLFIYKRRHMRSSFVSVLIISLVVLELFLYLPNDRSSLHNPQKQAPYIKFLKKEQKANLGRPFRVMALDRMLFPNSAALFKIEDVRLLDAIVIERYKDLVASFSDRVYGAHFTGHENFDFNSDLINLMGTRYIVSTDSLDSQLTSYFVRYAKPKPNYIKQNDEIIAVLKKSAPHIFKLAVPPTAKGISFKASAKSKTNLKVYVDEAEAVNQELDGTWQKIKVSAPSKENKPVIFNFETNMAKDNEIRIASIAYTSKSGEDAARYELIYDDDAKVYLNKGAFERAFIAYDYVSLKDSKTVLSALEENKYDISKTVLLEEKPPKKFKAKDKKFSSVDFIKNDLNSLKITASASDDSLLFLADNYYPGWKAYVNGKEAKIYRANYAFRAVALKKGKNIVEFKYRPASFIIGAYLALAGLLSLLAIFILQLFSKKKRASS